MLETVPNRYPNISTFQVHELELPSCCPVSQNPKAGSIARIQYTPKDRHIEVYSLSAFIESFKGGLTCPRSGAVVVRDMEAMIQLIAKRCAEALGVPVVVIALLILDAGKMTLTCRANP